MTIILLACLQTRQSKTYHSRLEAKGANSVCKVFSFWKLFDMVNSDKVEKLISFNFISDTGTPHELFHLTSLVKKLSKEIDELNGKLINKEDELSALLKRTAKEISEYDSTTNQLIQYMHEKRDDQVFL